MPIYEYQCADCGELHEALQKVSDAPLTLCPACGREGLRKKVSAAAFRLKGSGWYETDFKSGNKKNLAGEGAKDGAGETAKNGGGDGAKNAASESSGKASPGESGASASKAASGTKGKDSGNGSA